jgi:hypothetical protein
MRAPENSHDFKFLLTRRLNTDPIENLFGAIRQQGGNSDNPTPAQFNSLGLSVNYFSVLSVNLQQQVIVIKTWILFLLSFPKINQICLAWSAQVLQIIVIRINQSINGSLIA